MRWKIGATLSLAALIVLIFARSPYAATPYSEQMWVTYGRSQAAFLGLVGEPTSEEYALITWGQYLTLTHGEYDQGRPRDALIFIYEAFGDVPVYTGMGMGNGTTGLGGFTIISDAEVLGFGGSSAYPKTYIAEHGEGFDLSAIPADDGVSGTMPMPPAPTMIPMLSPESTRVPPEITAEPMP